MNEEEGNRKVILIRFVASFAAGFFIPIGASTFYLFLALGSAPDVILRVLFVPQLVVTICTPFLFIYLLWKRWYRKTYIWVGGMLGLFVLILFLRQ